MAYIGKEPIVGNFQVCDAITVVNGQAAYTLQVSSANVTPESSQHCLVSLNGVLQAPVTSFTVSGSTLTFASNLATGDVIDFVILLGSVLNLQTVSDGTITNAKLAQDIISGETALASEPADTDEFLVSDAGTLKRIDYSLIKGSGKVLQVVTATHATIVTQTANSYTSSGLTASITPSSASNKVAIMTGFNVETYGDGSSSSGRVAPVALFRGTTSGTNLIEQLIGLSDRTASSSTGTTGYNNVNFAYLDSPSTTSSQAYTVGISGSGATDVRAQPDSKKSSIILMEIAG